MNGAQVCVHALPAAPCAAAGPIYQHRQNLAIYPRAALSLFLWVRDGSKIEIPSALFGAPLSTARNKTLFGKGAETCVRATAREKERATGLSLYIDQHHGGRPLKWLFLKICTADSSLCGIEVRPYSEWSWRERKKSSGTHCFLRLDGQIKSSNLMKGSIYSVGVGIFFCRLRASMNFCIPTAGVHSLFKRVKNGV